MVSGPTPPPSSPSRAARLRGVSLLLVAVLALLADQESKHWVQDRFRFSDEYASAQIVVPDWLSLTYVRNKGAAFGVLPNETLLFVLIAVVVVGVIVAYFRFLPSNRPWLKLSLGLQLGGALGNLIDRLRQGYVVDFVSVKSFPIFNIADSCIVVGVVILAYYLLVAQGAPARSPAASATASSGQEPVRRQSPLDDRR